jgi:hypothetical protein
MRLPEMPTCKVTSTASQCLFFGTTVSFNRSMLAQKIVAILLAILCIAGAAWLITSALRFRLRGVAVTGIIVGFRSTYIHDSGVCRVATYRFTLPDGVEREAEGSFETSADGYAVGDRRKLFVLAHRPDAVYAADNGAREFFGLSMLAVGLYLLHWLWVGNGG